MNINQLLQTTIDHKASDLHLVTNQMPRIRVEGQLRALNTIPIDNSAMQKIITEIFNEDQQNYYRDNFDCDVAYTRDNIGRFRVNAYVDRHGSALAFRPIPEKIPDFHDLGLDDGFIKLCCQPNGIILITGPTGCGKSTTLAAMIDYINNNNHLHIITIEDPIEFYHHSKHCLINQREVRQHSKDFHTALRAALREDPDIILLGEMRDPETISLALTAAETGHLVLATLHTASAPKAITRILDAFPDAAKQSVRLMLSESLRAVVAQQLMKRIDGGRVAAREIMINTPAIANMIREEKLPQIYSAIQTGQAYGMMTMAQSVEKLVVKGLIEKF
ncbi:MAG: type IV pilus twitching motility protein PilT [Pseudomonadota bacterium]